MSDEHGTNRLGRGRFLLYAALCLACSAACVLLWLAGA